MPVHSDMSRSPCRLRHVLAAMSLFAACGEPADPNDDTTAATTAPATSTGEDTTTTPEDTTTTPTTGAPEPACTPMNLQPLQVVDDDWYGTDAQIGPGGACSWTLTLFEPRIVEFVADAPITVDDRPEDEPGWQRPREIGPGIHTITLTNPDPDAPRGASVQTRDRGTAPPPTIRERSLVWTRPELVDPPNTCGLACVMAAVSDDGHGGRLLRQWFDRFATTTHSERLGPKQLLDEFAAQQGTPPEAWNLDALPFLVTAVHSRLDLRAADRCGELRVSLASTHPILRPFHLIFLFAQRPVPEDISPSGALHCNATALRLARLGALDDPTFLTEVRALILERITPANFLAAESVEFTISPWEWRQWFFKLNDIPDPLLPRIFDNLPLFQTIDTPRLNLPGPARDTFLKWVDANADALGERRLLIPEEFRAMSARVNQGVPWEPLKLTPELDAAHPDLRKNLEIVGCPACHATDADFVQTLPNRTFSHFYDLELDARALHLDAVVRGTDTPAPFGPLQQAPLLPP